jgi:hypothetical protein
MCPKIAPVSLIPENIPTIDCYCIHKTTFLYHRFDIGAIELMRWYQAIFGKEMWGSVIIGVTFWKHTK